MKKLIITTIAALILASCGSVREVGSFTMVSTRNIDSKTDYQLLASFSGQNRGFLYRNRGQTIQIAIDNIVRTVPGGDFLKNAKVYLIDERFFAVEGDVWGLKQNQQFKGFAVGDLVYFKAFGNYVSGTIESLVDDTYCIVNCNNDLIKKKYDDLSRKK